jgi:hypothetical protein
MADAETPQGNPVIQHDRERNIRMMIIIWKLKLHVV